MTPASSPIHAHPEAVTPAPDVESLHPAPPAPDYTIVIPVYYNEGSLPGTMAAIKSEVLDRNPDRSAEIIFVDDGSGDASLERLHEIRAQYPGIVKVVKLSRNFGQVGALYAGFTLASGKLVVAMSADGQDPPELINQMIDAHFVEGYEVILCARREREESAYRRITSRAFYALVRKLCFAEMPAGGFDYVGMGRKALTALLQNREAHPFFQGQVLWTGFRPKLIEYVRRSRTHGKSRWTLGKKITYLIDGVLSYSFFPIRLMSVLGILCAVIGMLYAATIVVLRLTGDIPIQGWAPLMVVTLVIGGIQLLMMGVIGEYIWRTLAQSRNRAPYVIDRIYD